MTISGTATDEQALVVCLDNFLVNTVGWELTYKYVDTVTERRYGFTSTGEESEIDRMQLYAQVSSASNTTTFFTYTWLAGEAESGVGNTDACYDGTETRIQPGSGYFDFWITANKDVFYIMIKRHDNNTRYLGGVGYLSSPYIFKEDPLPAFAMGQNGTADTFTNTFRVRAYGTHSQFTNYTEGVGGGPFMDPSTTFSGGFSAYLGLSEGITGYVGLNGISARDGRLLADTIPLYRRETDSLVTNEGLRGYLPNIWNIHGSVDRPIGSFVVASGVNVFTKEFTYDDDVFIVMDELNSTNNTQMIGPITEFDTTSQSIPYTVGDGGRFQLWLSAYLYGIEHNGEYFNYNGKVSNWRSQRFHPNDELSLDSRNDASQSTLINQPRSVEEEALFNSNSVVRFTSADSSNLTGTLLASNDITIFAVASYSNGSSRAPIISIRGDEPGVDTLFSLEFNENSSNSATTIMSAGGGTDREEIVSLSPNTAYILSATVSGTDTTLYVNGWDGNSSTVTNTKSNVAIGNYTLNYSIGVNKVAGGSNGTVFADADIAEVLVYRQSLTVEDRDKITCMLGNRYNITVSGSC